MSSTRNISVPADTGASRETLLRRVLTPAPDFTIVGPDDSQRQQVEAVVAEKFEAVWQARITHFLPWLLSMHCLGHCSAVAGLRPAAGSRLFLEQYLNQSVEGPLSKLIGTQVFRRDIVEVGNLVASQRGASHLLFLVMTTTLHKAGYKWIVFTATKALRNNLDKLGFPLHKLAEVSPGHLNEAALAEWGRYYNSEPLVMAGSLDLAMQLISERPLMRRALRLYRNQINLLAATLRGS